MYIDVAKPRCSLPIKKKEKEKVVSPVKIINAVKRRGFVMSAWLMM
jgi:hypothetical protein